MFTSIMDLSYMELLITLYAITFFAYATYMVIYVLLPHLQHVYFVSTIVYRINSVLMDHTYTDNFWLFVKLLCLNTMNVIEIIENLDVTLAKKLCSSTDIHTREHIYRGIQDMVYIQAMYDLMAGMKDDFDVYITNEYESTHFNEIVKPTSYISLLHKNSSGEPDICVYTPLFVSDLIDHDVNTHLNRKLNILNTQKQWEGRQIFIQKLMKGFIREYVENEKNNNIYRFSENELIRNCDIIMTLTPLIQENLSYCDDIFFKPRNYKLLYYCLNEWYEQEKDNKKIGRLIYYCMDRYIEIPVKYLCKTDFPKEKEYPRLYRKIAYAFYKGQPKKISKSQKCKLLRELLKHLPTHMSKYNQTKSKSTTYTTINTNTP